MELSRKLNTMVLLLLLYSQTGCGPKGNTGYWLSFTDSVTQEQGYKSSNGDIAIPPGKYERCFTDTFKTYAIVAKPNEGTIAIDRQEKVLYEIFSFDNGPDEASEGLFRIMLDNKIGYADSMTGKIMIKPRFDCAWPFEDGAAKVSTDCKTQSDGEHSLWISDHWFYIDKSGKKLEKQNLANNPKKAIVNTWSEFWIPPLFFGFVIIALLFLMFLVISGYKGIIS